MLTLTRDTKRLTIIVIYIFLFIGLGIGLYFLFRPTPTCMDGKQNQDETGIDCGGVCINACMETITGDPIVIREVTALPIGVGKYDVVAKIANPNNAVGAASFTYTVKLLDATGAELGKYVETSWILPQETKSLLVFGMVVNGKPARATLEITGVNWQRLTNYAGRPRISVYNKQYTPSTNPGELGGVASGLVSNESGYDLRLVVVKIIARDKAGEPLAIQQTDLRTFLVGQQRDFHLAWPTPFIGKVATLEAETDADVYHSENFLRQYLPAGRAQEIVPTR